MKHQDTSTNIRRFESVHTLDIFFAPTTLFKRLDERPSWLSPFVIVTLLVILSAMLLAPVMESLAIRQMPEDLSAEMQDRIISSIKFSKYYG
jgi:hypothetical protein